MLNLFETKILGDDKFISAGKPSPADYLQALKLLDVNPKKHGKEDSYAGSILGLKAECHLLFLPNDIEILNRLINEFNQEKIQKIN